MDVCLSLPAHAGILAAEDYDAVVDLVVAFVERFDEKVAESIRFR